LRVRFADEPTGNLDSASGVAIMQALQKLNDDGHTIILVTHELTTAQHARRILHIRDGRIDKDNSDFKRVMAGEKDLLK
jgi:putative ABC transport system ATP-binding protein